MVDPASRTPLYRMATMLRVIHVLSGIDVRLECDFFHTKERNALSYNVKVLFNITANIKIVYPTLPLFIALCMSKFYCFDVI